MGDESDTELSVWTQSGDTYLMQNDDFNKDASSCLIFTAPGNGEYFVRVRLYDPTSFGTGTEYALTISTGDSCNPQTDPETEFPDIEERPKPPEGGIQTLILINRARMGQLHGDVEGLMAKLGRLARHEKVNGEIIDLNRNTQVSNAYAEWLATAKSEKSVAKANQVADEIRRVIMTYLDEHGGVKYVVLVGTDRALPFRRVVDGTPQLSEKTYTSVTDNHPTGAAILQDYFLTDDFYVDREPVSPNGREVYIPDAGLSTGRLIETPDDMIKLIDIFLANPVTQVDNVFISGYDFVKDSASNDCVAWRKVLDPDGSNRDAVSCMISENWRGIELLTNQTSTEPVYMIQSINGHADHYAAGAPDKTLVRGTDIDSKAFDLPGGLVYTLSCHGGLNVPDEFDSFTTDLPQSFVRKGANYVGNTGYGWGYRGAIGLSEQVIQLFTARLVKGGPMGPALAEAKAEYYKLTKAAKSYDEKVMQQFIFYGLPMFEHGQGSLSGDDDPFAGLVGDDFELSLTTQDQFTNTISFEFIDQVNPEDEILSLNKDDENGTENTFGSYQSLAAYSYAEEGQPVQPLYFKDVTQAASDIRSVVVRSAEIDTDVIPDFDPIVATVDNEFVLPQEGAGNKTESDIAALATVEDAQIESAWYPATIVDVQSLDGESTLSTRLGQFNPATNEQRNFKNLDVDVYYSLSSDTQGPDVVLVTGLVTPDCEAGTAGLVSLKGVVIRASKFRPWTKHLTER